jgi:hypothetical protein
MAPPPLQVALAQKYGKQYGVDPKLLLAIGGHETQWGTTGAGRPSQGGYALGYGVTDSGILSKYAGLQNQYRYGASTLSSWGVHSLADILAGKASRWATDPAWEQGVRSVYGSLGGQLPVSAPQAITDMAMGTKPRRTAAAPTKPAKPQYKAITESVYDPGALAQGIFGSLASGGLPDIASLTAGAWKNQTSYELVRPTLQPKGARGPMPHSDASPPPNQPIMAVTPKNVSKWAIAGGGMDRSGLHTNPAVFNTVAKIAQLYGSPLTIGTGTNHNEFVKGSNRRSDHWFGQAADIPMAGAQLTRLGQDALIMAGMDPREARKQTGGVFNVGGYNILFNTNVGGNHYNHLHVGMGRILGRPA